MSAMRTSSGKVIVVVGASGGLGRAISAELRSRGATVLGAGRSGPDIVLDLRDSHAGDALVRGALGMQGRLDGVIIAAGIVAFGDLASTDDVVIEELFLTNALGPLWMARRVLPSLAEHQGYLAMITGVVAEQSLPGLVPYCASKAALSHLTAVLATELVGSGVTTFAIAPMAATEMLHELVVSARMPAPLRAVFAGIEQGAPERILADSLGLFRTVLSGTLDEHSGAHLDIRLPLDQQLEAQPA